MDSQTKEIIAELWNFIQKICPPMYFKEMTELENKLKTYFN